VVRWRRPEPLAVPGTAPWNSEIFRDRAGPEIPRAVGVADDTDWGFLHPADDGVAVFFSSEHDPHRRVITHVVSVQTVSGVFDVATERRGIRGEAVPFSVTVHVLLHTGADEDGVEDHFVCRSCYEAEIEPLFAES